MRTKQQIALDEQMGVTASTAMFERKGTLLICHGRTPEDAVQWRDSVQREMASARCSEDAAMQRVLARSSGVRESKSFDDDSGYERFHAITGFTR